MGLLANFNNFLNQTIFLPDPIDPYNISQLIKYKLIYELNGVYYFYEPHEVSASQWAISCHGCDSICETLDYLSDKCKVICFAVHEKHNKHIKTILNIRKGTKLLKGVKR